MPEGLFPSATSRETPAPWGGSGFAGSSLAALLLLLLFPLGFFSLTQASENGYAHVHTSYELLADVAPTELCPRSRAPFFSPVRAAALSRALQLSEEAPAN